MIKPFYSIAILLLFSVFPLLSQGQEKTLSLMDVWGSGRFIPSTFSQVNHLKDGSHFSRLKKNPKTNDQYLLKYHYKSGEPKDTILNTGNLEKWDLRINDYRFSSQENYLLLKTQTQRIYRYSTRAVFYVYDIEKAKITPVHEGRHVMYASISPNEKHLAFVHKNNVYTQSLKTGKIQQITTDGEKNKILNGKSDWVYEEEFELVQAFEWSPDGEKIAYYKFKQIKLKNYTLKRYIDSNYPMQYTYKYPKAGEPNSDVSLHIYHLDDQRKVKVDKGEKKLEYYPRIKWTNNPDVLAFQEMNRHQNTLNLHFAEAGNGQSRKVLTKNSDTYLEINDNLTFLEDNQFLWTSEKDGYRHIYLFNEDGEKIRQVTNGEWVVTKFIGYDPEEETIYYQSTEVSPLERHVYSISIEGKEKQKLVGKEGTNNVNFSSDYSYYIGTHTSADKPPKTSVYNEDGEKIREPITNQAVKKLMNAYNFSGKTFFKFKTRDGTSLNGWMLKPKNFNPNKEYPVFMTCYGGPGVQTVTKDWGWRNYNYYQYLAQNGYIVVSVDNRGTIARGTQFKKMTYQNLGHYESIDQIEAAKYLADKDYIDENRIGIFGWSYGGYLTLLSLAKGADVFQTGVAVAPVTDWRFYDNIYTERYMRKPSENQEGYRKSSVLNYVDSFEDKFLLIHGMYDDNVHPQNSMELMKRLVKHNKPFNSEFYPNKTHSIGGGWTRYHLFNRVTEFINENLKTIEENEKPGSH